METLQPVPRLPGPFPVACWKGRTYDQREASVNASTGGDYIKGRYWIRTSDFFCERMTQQAEGHALQALTISMFGTDPIVFKGSAH
jgi:hypothetical protein